MAQFESNATMFPSSGAALLKGKKEIEEYFKRTIDNTVSRNTHTNPHAALDNYGDVTIRTGESTIDLNMKDGKIISFPIRTTFVLKKEGEDWKILHMHISRESSSVSK